MSDLPQPGHLPALEAVLGAWPGTLPSRALRATDQVFADLQLLNRYKGPTDDEASGRGAFQQVIEDLERQREWLRALGETPRCQDLASELDRPPNRPDHNSPKASPCKVPFPQAKFQELVEKFKSLDPGLTRPQQYAAVRNSPEFARYHLTDLIFREVAKVVPVPKGRPRKQKQT